MDLQRAYFMSAPVFNIGYDMSEELGHPTELGPSIFWSLAQKMLQDSALYAKWALRRDAYSTLNEQKYLCAMLHSSIGAYNKCVASFAMA